MALTAHPQQQAPAGLGFTSRRVYGWYDADCMDSSTSQAVIHSSGAGLGGEGTLRRRVLYEFYDANRRQSGVSMDSKAQFLMTVRRSLYGRCDAFFGLYRGSMDSKAHFLSMPRRSSYG